MQNKNHPPNTFKACMVIHKYSTYVNHFLGHITYVLRNICSMHRIMQKREEFCLKLQKMTFFTPGGITINCYKRFWREIQIWLLLRILHLYSNIIYLAFSHDLQYYALTLLLPPDCSESYQFGCGILKIWAQESTCSKEIVLKQSCDEL